MTLDTWYTADEGDTLTLYILTRTDNEERIERKFPGADLVNANEVDIGAVVSTVDQVCIVVSKNVFCHVSHVCVTNYFMI